MSRLAGDRGRVYMGITSAGTAEPLPFIATWSLEMSTDKYETTAMGDTNKVYVAGLPDASGSFSGFFDDATQQTYTAATDGVARKFYLYVDVSGSANDYFFGTILPDFSVSGGVGEAIKLEVSWNAASTIARVAQ